jgi:L-alanine-DL-glutamate epimerase-like enolase superfamily enzyme
MRVVHVSVETVEIPLRATIRSRAMDWDRTRVGLVALATETGLNGRGEYPAPFPGDLGDDASPGIIAALEALDLADPVGVARALRTVDALPFVGRAARSAVESALVDLVAQAEGRSIAESLAGSSRDDVAVNALLGIAGPDELAAEATRLVRAGFRCLKLKAGAEPREAIVERVAAVREAVGHSVSLRVDFNGSLDRGSAADILAAVSPFELEYAEQPLPPSAGAEALARLRWTGAVPIAADEAVRDVGAARVLLDTGAVDVLVVKPARVGGLRQAAAIIDLATAAAVPVTISTMFETGIGVAGALHLAATIPAGTAHGLSTSSLLESDVLRAPLEIRDGRMRVPGGPGLGVEPDPTLVARYLTA